MGPSACERAAAGFMVMLNSGIRKGSGSEPELRSPLVTTPSGDLQGEAEMHTTDNDKRGFSGCDQSASNVACTLNTSIWETYWANCY